MIPSKKIEKEQKLLARQSVEIKTELDSYFHELQTWLQSQHQHLVDQLNKGVKNRKDNLDQQYQQLNSSYDRWKTTTEQAQKLLQGSNKVQAVELLSNLAQLQRTKDSMSSLTIKERNIKLNRTFNFKHNSEISIGEIVFTDDINIDGTTIEEFESKSFFDKPSSFLLLLKNKEGKILKNLKGVQIQCEIKDKITEKRIESQNEVIEQKDGAYRVSYIVPGVKKEKAEYELTLVVDGQICPGFPKLITVGIRAPVRFSRTSSQKVVISNNNNTITRVGNAGWEHAILNQSISEGVLVYKIYIESSLVNWIMLMVCEGDPPSGDDLKGHGFFLDLESSIDALNGQIIQISGNAGDVLELTVDLIKNIFRLHNLTKDVSAVVNLPAGKKWTPYCTLFNDTDKVTLID